MSMENPGAPPPGDLEKRFFDVFCSGHESDHARKLEIKAKEHVVRIGASERSGFLIVLESHNEGLELRVSVTPKGRRDTPIRSLDVLQLLEENKIIGTPLLPEIDQLCLLASRGEPQEKILILCGTTPQKGKDERIRFFSRPYTGRPSFEADADGGVDYTRTNLFENVKADSIVAVLLPPEPGVDGMDIHGTTIPALSGLSFEPPPKLGKYIRKTYQGYLCEINGMVCFQNNTLSATDHFEVNNVDLSVGHIDFVGSVEVKGDVMDGLGIRCGGPLIVRGVIGNCKADCAGDAEIGGMVGGSISVGGSLTARHIKNAQVVCKGDMTVKNSIINCDIKCAGAVSVPTGAVMGGEIIALKGVEARSIGSESQVKTHVTSGVSFEAEDKISHLSMKMKIQERELAKISNTLNPLLSDLKAVSMLTPAQKVEIQLMGQRFTELITVRDDLQDEIKEIRAEVKRKANPIITVTRQIDKGVLLTVGSSTEMIAKEIGRGVTILENSRRGGLRFTKPHPISASAAAIEKAIAMKEIEDEQKAAST